MPTKRGGSAVEEEFPSIREPQTRTTCERKTMHNSSAKKRPTMFRKVSSALMNPKRIRPPRLQSNSVFAVPNLGTCFIFCYSSFFALGILFVSLLLLFLVLSMLFAVCRVPNIAYSLLHVSWRKCHLILCHTRGGFLRKHKSQWHFTIRMEESISVGGHSVQVFWDEKQQAIVLNIAFASGVSQHHTFFEPAKELAVG